LRQGIALAYQDFLRRCETQSGAAA